MNKELLQNVLGVGNYFSEKVKMMALELKAADEALANMTADRDSCIYCIGGADMSKELLQQALDALTKFRYSTDSCDRRVDTVIKALEKAIAKSADTGDKMAYEGAQEDLLIWKRRALEAEANVRHLTSALQAEVNGSTFMGEPTTLQNSQPVQSAEVTELPPLPEPLGGMDVDLGPAGAAYMNGARFTGVEDAYSADQMIAYALAAIARPVQPSSVVRPVPVGEADYMPGTTGFTMACFKADDVPVGTKLYIIAKATESAS